MGGDEEIAEDVNKSMGNYEETAEDESGSMGDDGDETTEASSGKGGRRHLKIASQLFNIALKLVGI
jgi:hypothetical protein